MNFDFGQQHRPQWVPVAEAVAGVFSPVPMGVIKAVEPELESRETPDWAKFFGGLVLGGLAVLVVADTANGIEKLIGRLT